jgi:hypothetical protein
MAQVWEGTRVASRPDASGVAGWPVVCARSSGGAQMPHHSFRESCSGGCVRTVVAPLQTESWHRVGSVAEEDACATRPTRRVPRVSRRTVSCMVDWPAVREQRRERAPAGMSGWESALDDDTARGRGFFGHGGEVSLQVRIVLPVELLCLLDLR